MNRMIFDTETTSIDTPFCYDIGYYIIDEDFNILEKKHFIIEQIWHNLPLFEGAYYKEKRPLYIKLMREHKVTIKKYGYVMQKMKKDIKKYDVKSAYAYNSDFDKKVINFNCDWFKCLNPFENLSIFDIWGYASCFITNHDNYKEFCEKFEYFTDNGNYKANAEIVFRFLTNNTNFDEAHMGLYDAEIEAAILQFCFKAGAIKDYPYKPIKILNRITPHHYTIKVNKNIIYEGQYIKKYNKNDVWYFTE